MYSGSAIFDPQEDHLGVTDDRGDGVVEIMRDAAGQLADGVHLLDLPELLFELLSVRDVAEDDDATVDLLLRALADRRDAVLDVQLARHRGG